MIRIIMGITNLIVLTVTTFMMAACSGTSEDSQQPTSDGGIKSTNEWQSPSEDLLNVLHAPQLPWVWATSSGEYLFLADPVIYPPLAELAAPMHKLAGIRVNPVMNNHHGQHGGTSPRLVRVEDGTTIPLNLPPKAEVHDVEWTVNGQRFALTVAHGDNLGLWIGSVDGELNRIENLALNPLLGTAVSWLPDQERLLLRRIPQRGPAPKPPAIPTGPEIVEGVGATARSTYEARNLLQTAHDDALFEYYTTSELVILDPPTGKLRHHPPVLFPFNINDFSLM